MGMILAKGMRNPGLKSQWAPLLSSKFCLKKNNLNEKQNLEAREITQSRIN